VDHMCDAVLRSAADGNESDGLKGSSTACVVLIDTVQVALVIIINITIDYQVLHGVLSRLSSFSWSVRDPLSSARDQCPLPRVGAAQQRQCRRLWLLSHRQGATASHNQVP
jgi:hypothetical protein